MKLEYLGLVLATIVAATLAAYVPAKDESGAWQHWAALAPIVVVFGLGLLVRLRARQRHAAVLAGGEARDFGSAAAQLHSSISAISSSLRADTPELRRRARATIDELDTTVIDPLIEQRQSLALELGLSEFAERMSQFARGERALHRAWSALTDDHLDEARSALREAEALFGAMAYGDRTAPAT